MIYYRKMVITWLINGVIMSKYIKFVCYVNETFIYSFNFRFLY